MLPKTVLLIALLLFTALCAAGQLQVVENRPAAAAAAVDFGANLVDETVDLAAAHNTEEDAQTKDMESLLHWAIEHSDPEKLRQQAEEVQNQDAVQDFLDKKKRVAELAELVNSQKTETQMIKDLVAVLAQSDASTSEKAAALAELQVLVEPIDNANDLKVLGALQPLLDLLSDDQHPELQEGAAYVLGTAASNNAKLVELLLQDHPGLLGQLLKLAGSSNDGAAVKAMYALGTIVRGPVPEARGVFYSSGGLGKLQTLMGPKSKVCHKVKAKALNLITDLIELTATGDDNSLDTFEPAVLGQFAAAALDMLQQSEELDSRERALMAMRILLMRRGLAGREALEEEGAEAVLREVLTELDLMTDELSEAAGLQQQALLLGKVVVVVMVVLALAVR